MIGRLRGIVLVKRPPHILLDVHGVGYELEAPGRKPVVAISLCLC